MFNDVTNNVIIPAAGAKSSENLKLEIIRTLEQLNYQGNCHKLKWGASFRWSFGIKPRPHMHAAV